MVVALLLLLAGVERNPGPAAAVCRNDVVLGSINIHSAFDRAALVHTIIADLNIDCMALQETWIDVNDPNAIVADVALAGYGVLHVHCPSKVSVNRRLHRGGSLAIINNSTIQRQSASIAAHNESGYIRAPDRCRQNEQFNWCNHHQQIPTAVAVDRCRHFFRSFLT